METLFYYAVLAILSYLLAPKPETIPPAKISDSDIPIAEEGVEIAVLFGTRDFSGPNVVWYGDIGTKEVKSKTGKK